MGLGESLTRCRVLQSMESCDTGEFGDKGSALRKSNATSQILAGRGTFLRSGTAIGGVLLAMLAMMPLSITPVWADASIDLAGSNQTVGSLDGNGLVTNSGPGAATLTTNGDNSSTVFNGVIQDGVAATALTKMGSGALTLNGDNTYSGGTTLDVGTIVVGGNTALGSGKFTVGGNTTLSANTSVILANAIELQALLTVSGSNDITFSNTAIGTGGFVMDGTGVLTLSGNSPFTGGTTLNSGTIVVGSDTALGQGALTVGGAATLSANTTVSLDNAIVLNAGLTIGGSGNLTLTQHIAGAGGLTMAGTGVLTLSGNNTFTGGTTLKSGTMSVSSASNIGNAFGELIFDGGVLQVTGTTFTSLNAANTSWQNGGGGFDIADANNTFTVSLALGGSGGLKKAGAGTLVLSGTNTYTGATTVTAGTLQAGGVNAFAPASAFDVDAAATLDLNNFNQTIGGLQGAGVVNLGSATLTVGGNNSSTTFLGTIEGSGAVVKVGSGSIALGAASTSWSGGLVVQDGLVLLGDDQALGTGALTLDGGGIKAAQTNMTLANSILLTTTSGNTIDNGGNHLVLDGVLSNATLGQDGTVSFDGAGTTVLNGVNTYTGTTQVTAGTLVVGDAAHAGASLASNVIVATGATLTGSGSVGGITIAAGGFVASGSSPGTLNVAGDLLLSSGSTYNVAIEGSGASDLIAVAGTATVTGSHVTVTALDPRASYQGGQTYTILTAAGGVIGAFDPTVLSHSAFIDATLAPSLNAVDLVIALKSEGPVFTTVADTGNQLATAGALDTLEQSGPSLDLYNKLLLLDASEARAAFGALSGEVYASARSALIEDSSFVRDAANNRIRTAFAAVGATPMPVLAYGETASGNDATSSIGNVLAPADTDRFAAWGSAFGSWGSTDGNGNVAGLDRSTGGFLTGVDGLVTENVRLGLMTGYSHTSFDADDRASSGKSDNYHLGIYGGTQWGALALRSGLAYTWHNISTNRSVAFPGFTDSLSADYDAGTTQAFGELGYRIDTQAASFEPFANLAYVNLHTDGFTEKGGAAALTSASQTTDTTFTTLGVRASTDFDVGGAKATARGMIGWRHAFGDIVPTATNTFSGSDAFTIAGVPITKDAAVIEAGLDFAVGQNTTVGLSYNGQFGSGSIDNGAKADLRVRF